MKFSTVKKKYLNYLTQIDMKQKKAATPKVRWTETY